MSSFSWNGSPTWTLGRFAGPVLSKVSLARTRDAADAVAAGAGAVEDHLVAGAGRLREVDLLVPHDADAQRVDERVAGVRRVEDRLAADVRAGRGSCRSHRRPPRSRAARGGCPSASRGPKRRGSITATGRAPIARMSRTMPPTPGRRALVGLDVGRVVVRLDLERHRVAVADVDDAGVLADADHEVLAHLVGDLLAELAQVHLRRLVGAVLAPHHRVHRQLAARRAAAEDLADLGVLVRLEAEVRPRLLVVGGRRGGRDRVEVRERRGLGCHWARHRAVTGRLPDECCDGFGRGQPTGAGPPPDGPDRGWDGRRSGGRPLLLTGRV